jgi:ribonuclease I
VRCVKGSVKGEVNFVKFMAFPNPETGAVPGHFESYVYAMSWRPAWNLDACPGQRYAAPGVLALTSNTLNVHGLWPNYDPARHNGSTWPQYCGAYQPCFATHDVGQMCPPEAAVYSEFNVSSKWHTYALEYAFSTLATHEWAKHGSCTPWAFPNHSVGQRGYFAKEEEIYNIVQAGQGWALLRQHIGSSVSATALRAAFQLDAGGAAPAIQCHSCSLSEVWLGIAADADWMPRINISAWQGVNISGQDTCRSCSTITVNAWTGCPAPPALPAAPPAMLTLANALLVLVLVLILLLPITRILLLAIPGCVPRPRRIHSTKARAEAAMDEGESGGGFDMEMNEAALAATRQAR